MRVVGARLAEKAEHDKKTNAQLDCALTDNEEEEEMGEHKGPAAHSWRSIIERAGEVLRRFFSEGV